MNLIKTIGAAAIRRVSVLAIAGGLLVVMAGVVSAAIPSANGTIYACYDKTSGQTRLTDPATNVPKACGPKEAAVSWNAQGPAGPAGVSGYVRVVHASAMNSAYDKTDFVDCPAGTQVIGGGAGVFGADIGIGTLIVDGVGLVQSIPFNTTGWAARAEEFVPTDADWEIEVYALCAAVN